MSLSTFMRFQALVEKQIFDETGKMVIRTTEKKASLSNEIRKLVGKKMEILPNGAVAGAYTPHMQTVIYDLSTFEAGGADVPAVDRHDVTVSA